MRYILLFICFLATFLCMAKGEGIQQLEQQLKAVHAPEKKVELLNKLCEQHLYKDPQKALTYGKKAVQLAKGTDNQQLLSNAYNNLGIAYVVLNDYPKAASNYYKALEIRQAINDSVGISGSYNNLGLIYYGQKEYKKALEFFEKALNMKEARKDFTNIVPILNNIAAVHINNNQPEKAITYLERGIEICEATENSDNLSVSLVLMGYVVQDTPGKALKYYKRALELIKQVGNKTDESTAYSSIAQAYLKLNKYSEALHYSHQSLTLSKEYKSPNAIRNAAELLQAIYRAQGNYEKAYEYVSLASSYKDSLYTTEKEKQLAEMHTKYETEKKEEENRRLLAEQRLQQQQLKQKTQVQYATALLLLLTAALAFVFFRGRRRVGRINQALLLKNQEILEKNHSIQQQTETLGLQANLLQQQKDKLEETNQIKDKLFSIVAHDLRGPLVSLKSLLQLLNMGMVPETRLRKFLHDLEAEQQNTLWLLDNLLVWARSQLQGMRAEPRQLALRQLVEENLSLLSPQAALKQVSLQNHVPPSALALADHEMIKLVLRNLLSNAIKYCSAGDAIAVSARQVDDTVTVTVQDSGTGISQENLERLFGAASFTTRGTANEKGSGLGLMLCKDFIERNLGTIWARSEPNNGSTFSFTLPVVKGSQQEVTAQHQAMMA